MGEVTKIFGCIEGGLHHTQPKQPEFYQHNYDVIASLPSQVDLARNIFFSRETFTVPMNTGGSGFYRVQLIHFAQSFKYLDDYLDGWIESFESLLRNLFWWETYLFVEQEATWQKTQFYWKADISPMLDDPPTPPQIWDFFGGIDGYPPYPTNQSSSIP